MSVDQTTKLAHQLILLIITFLYPLVEREEKAHTCHATRRALSKAIKEQLARRSRLTLVTSTSASLITFYLRLIPQ